MREIDDRMAALPPPPGPGPEGRAALFAAMRIWSTAPATWTRAAALLTR